jgi:ribose transport system permease protein
MSLHESHRPATAGSQGPLGQEPKRARRLRRTSDTVATTRAVYGLLVLIFFAGWFVVEVVAGEDFMSRNNIVDMLQRCVALGIVSAGQTVVILGGSLDLSVAEVINASSLVGAEFMDGQSSRLLPGILVVVALGMVVGLVNGLVITGLKVNAFIATLGMAFILRGLIQNRYSAPAGAVPPELRDLAYTRFAFVPASIFVLVVVVAAVWFLLHRTRLGYRIYAVGGDQEVSRLSGVRTSRTIISAHVICSVLAALTGLFLASRLGAGAPRVGTEGGYDLESIAAVVLGGAYLLGGRGAVLGTVAGVFILAVMDNVFNALEFDSFLKQVVRGVIIIVAVAAYGIRMHRRKAA